MLINGIRTVHNTPDFQRANASVGKNLSRLSSGKWLSSAADDTAAMAIAEKLEAELKSHAQAERNISYGTDLTSTADAALGHQCEILSRMRELAVQGANGTLDTKAREAINNEFNSLREEFDRVAATTEYNGQSLLQGGDLDIQAGIDADPTSQVDLALPDTQVTSLGLGAVDLTTQAGSMDGLSSLDTAITDLGADRAELGATANRLGFAESVNDVITQNKASSASGIGDTDYAEEASALHLNRFRAQVALKARSIESEARGGLLNLIA